MISDKDKVWLLKKQEEHLRKEGLKSITPLVKSTDLERLELRLRRLETTIKLHRILIDRIEKVVGI